MPINDDEQVQIDNICANKTCGIMAKLLRATLREP